MIHLVILMLSIILIVVGFIMTITGIALKILDAIFDLFKAIIYFTIGSYHKKNVVSKLGSAQWSPEELAMIDQIEYSKRNKYETRARQEVYEGILLFSSRMKAKYPKADQSLFDKVENEFLQASDLNIFKEYEAKIRDSHVRNSI
ncbi:gp235 [Bacillus phage G]|uniref:Gp235 n=1 Tax=Bacillus phage G TaxID=2884420 RepID=G3M9X6_9CAUD|nr:gp235 [Bacillus phage G]AEO93494.1 gp235 [Bacillus phage G]